MGLFRYPRVSFRTERPFLIGIICTYAIWTKLHYDAYSKCNYHPLILCHV